MAIHLILILNRQGKVRLSKWYNRDYSSEQQTQYISEIHRIVSSRDAKKQSNFIDFHSNKLVYRRYAGLYFAMIVDVVDNELSYLESLHFFVEILDTYFDNVCELDLVFNFYKLYFILDEVYLGGQLHEIAKSRVLSRVMQLEALD